MSITDLGEPRSVRPLRRGQGEGKAVPPIPHRGWSEVATHEGSFTQPLALSHGSAPRVTCVNLRLVLLLLCAITQTREMKERREGYKRDIALKENHFFQVLSFDRCANVLNATFIICSLFSLLHG